MSSPVKLTNDFNKASDVCTEPAFGDTEYGIIMIQPDKNNHQERRKLGSGGLICVANVFLIGGLAAIPWSICVLVSRTQSKLVNRVDTTSWRGNWMARSG